MLLLRDQASALHPIHGSRPRLQLRKCQGMVFLCTQRGRGKEGREVCQGKWFCYTQSVFFGCLFPTPRPGCGAGFGRLSPPGLSRGVALLQALIRCVLVSKTIQTKAFHLHLCTVPALGQGLVSAPGRDWSTTNSCEGKLMGFLVFNFVFRDGNPWVDWYR